MNKISNKLILIFGILAFILGLSLSFSSPVYARENNGVIPFPYLPYSLPRTTYSVQNTPSVYTVPIYYNSTVIDGCNGRNTGFSTTTRQSCVGNYVVTPTTTIVKVPSTSVTTTTTNNKDTSASDVNKDYSGIAANALFGANSFMPSGLLQWIIFAVLVLAIIFLWRYVYAEDKYMSEPLKHA